MLNVVTQILLDKRFQKKDFTYSVKLRLTFNRTQKYYPVNISLSEEDWEKTQSTKPKGKMKELQLAFQLFEQKANTVLSGMESFDFNTFEKKFNSKPTAQKDVFYFFETYISKLKNEKRASTADSYKCAYNSIRTFFNSKRSKQLPFSNIDTNWLQNYENWMIGKGKSLTSTGIYLRSLRTIFNIAIEEGVIQKETYPFGKRKYSIPAGQNIKKALTISDVKRIIDYQTETIAQEKAKDIWIFSYLCNGANMKDIAMLKWSNLDSKKITFIRAKTARTTKQNTKPIVVMMLPKIKEIIDKWAIPSSDQNEYIFGVLYNNDTPETTLKKTRQFIKTTNKYMKKIGTDLQFELKLTTYSARHTYATVLKRSGAPIELISESLGHKDLRTTENYLDSFEDDEKQKYQNMLLDF